MITAMAAINNLHRLILTHGRDAAKAMQPDQSHLIDVAANMLTAENRIGITYTGFCLTALPHRKLQDEAAWQREGHNVTLLVEPGHLRIGGVIKKFGVPYGARARLILIYLQTQAIRTGRREVELGGSMRAWLTRMGVSPGGETFRAYREQCLRISACSLKFFWNEERGGEAFEAGSIIKKGLLFSDQANLWTDVVQLDEAFFNSLQAHPVPLQEEAIQQLSGRSMALDVYVWLAYRLHSLGKPQSLTWASLYQQFGAGFSQVKHFKPRFIEALHYVLAVYPEAKVEGTETGILLFQSLPPVRKLISGR